MSDHNGGIIDAIDHTTRGGVMIDVGNNPGLIGMLAGQQRRVPRASLGGRMGLIAASIDHAAGEPLQPAGELTAPLVEQISAKLVDADGHNKLRCHRLRSSGSRRQAKARRRDQDQQISQVTFLRL